MLSNKWTFSLTSLVVIFALCCVAPALAAEFGLHLTVPSDVDVSHADHIQVAYSTDTATTIKIRSDKVINIAASDTGKVLDLTDFVVTSYNGYGGTTFANVTPPALSALAIDGTADGMHFMMTLAAVNPPAADANPDAIVSKVVINIAKHEVELADPLAEMDGDARKLEGKSAAASITLYYVSATEGTAIGTIGDNGTFNASTTAGDPGRPIVHSIARADGGLRAVTAATFDVLITLSEEPKKDGFKKDRIDVTNATWGDPSLLDKIDQTATMQSSGRDMMLYRYLVTITPKYENKNDIVVKVKSFYDQEKMDPKMYMPPSQAVGYMEGMHKLTVKVGKEVLKDKAAGLEVEIPKEKRIPAGGYIVFTKNQGQSGVVKPGGSDKDEPKRNERSEAEMLYNVLDRDLPNLETFLANGGTIDLVAPAGVYISEIMWGSDASLDTNNNSQWIEVANKGTSSILTGDKTHKLIFYGPNETLPDVSTVADRVGTVGAGGYWSIAGKGQSGRTGTDEKGPEIVALVPTQALISMQRVMDAAGAPADGTMASSWAASSPPGLNFDVTKVGTRIGTPGAAPVAYPVAPTPPPAAVVVPVAMPDDIMITEIMVDTGNGRLPQWIELTNVSGAEVSLAGWSLMITNAEADADAIGETVSINLSGTLGVGGGMDAGGTMGKSLLLVGGAARSSSNLAGSARVVDISSQVDQTGRYTFISTMAFMAALVPPQMTGVVAYGDTAGNLGADEAWEIPMDESGRSSLIRREMLDDGMATMGTDANGWVLASSTSLVSGPATWYGSDEDAGTPGYDAGGPLPVELSHFRPARDKATGAVVITWSTQSELNNAGFFIKRSQQRDGQFQVINATMVAGAGTTSEKQSYTYTDSTAQPNVVYYYQIEDVSLDGNRQTLTHGIRLKGHIGAAGKLTTTWGDLKDAQE